MQESSDKKKIYELINLYLSEEINESNFCNNFIVLYDQEIDYDTLDNKEHQALSNLGKIASRFSDFEKDIKKYPGTYYSKKELKQAVIETKQLLKEHFEKFKETDQLES